MLTPVLATPSHVIYVMYYAKNGILLTTNVLCFSPAVNNVLKTFETAHECTFENSAVERMGMKKLAAEVLLY